MKKELLEKYSSAATLSDMEIFVFPELMYSLVLANIMSPLFGNGVMRILLKNWKIKAHIKNLCG